MKKEGLNKKCKMDTANQKKKLKFTEEKDGMCMWVPGKKGVLAKVGDAREISKAFGLVNPMSFKQLKENARFVTLSDTAELITLKEMLDRKKEMENKGKSVSLV